MSTEPAKPEPAKPDPASPASAPPAPTTPTSTPAATSTAAPLSDGDTTGIGDRLGRGWESFKAGKVISYRWMAIILLVVVGGGVGWYIWWESRKAESAKWVASGDLTTLERMEQFENQYPGSSQAKAVRLQRIRVMLGTQGVDVLRALASPQGFRQTDPNARTTAVESVEKARELADRSADEFKDDPAARVQCLYIAAIAEETLIAFPKAASPGEARGSVDRFIERLEQLATTAPDSEWGKWARKRADALKLPGQREELVRIQREGYLPLMDRLGGAARGTQP